MRRPGLPIAALALAASLAAAGAPQSAGASGSGGAGIPSSGGGTGVGQAAPQPAAKRPASSKKRPARGAPKLVSFAVSRSKIFVLGHPAKVRFRIDSRATTIRVRLVLRRPGTRRAAASIPLGARATRRLQSVSLSGRDLAQGRYVLGISARDGRGRPLRRARSVKATREVSFVSHRFPLVGAFSYGGPGARFGAGRPGHIHQGQDLVAASGTPIVAPRGGVVKTVAYQAGGAGHYVVVSGSGENRDYVFMHMLTGSVRVRVGQRVRTGQRLGDVGSTGGSSGPHLHFEVWVGGWFSGGKPVDPLPLLRAWDAAD
jgi:murein DD-endopeptidase MepM/ murein hydrolase activator NlpD